MRADEEGTGAREPERGGGTGRKWEEGGEDTRSNCDGGDAEDTARAEEEDDGCVKCILRSGSASSKKVGDTLQCASAEAMIRLLPPSSTSVWWRSLKV